MKNIINKILSKFGYRIRAIHAPLQSFKEGVQNVSKLFPVDVVVDIGVAHHTRDLYDVFPGKQFFLIEANPQFKSNLDNLKNELSAKVEMVFCGDSTGEVTINLPKNGRRASAYDKNPQGETLTIKKEPLDTLMSRNGFSEANNILVKIDVEGAEIDVLLGASETLKRTNIAIIEICWGVPFSTGAADYVDVFKTMSQHGFTLHNIVEGSGIQKQGRLTHADFIFVKA